MPQENEEDDAHIPYARCPTSYTMEGSVLHGMISQVRSMRNLKLLGTGFSKKRCCLGLS